MRDNIFRNLKEINQYVRKRSKKLNSTDRASITVEFKEWIDDSFEGKESVWTLPDLTRTDLLNNFCRSIKKKIY